MQRCAECIRYVVRTKTTAECTHWFVFCRNTVSALIQQMKGHRKVDFGVRFYLLFFMFIFYIARSFVCFKFIFPSLFVMIFFSFLIYASTKHMAHSANVLLALSTVVSCCLPRCMKATDINYQICQLLYCEQSLFIRVWTVESFSGILFCRNQ